MCSFRNSEIVFFVKKITTTIFVLITYLRIHIYSRLYRPINIFSVAASVIIAGYLGINMYIYNEVWQLKINMFEETNVNK